MTTLFVSHGSPLLALESGATGMALAHIAAQLPRPTGVVVISAHWDTAQPAVSSTVAPATMHDFAGFPRALYEIQYPATGSTGLAAQVLACLQQKNIVASNDTQRGLDHGAWVPLRLMYPNADMPVVQLSIQSRHSTAAQYALGQALQPLHAQGILILASGAITHNLSDFDSTEREAPALPYVQPFADWMAKAIAEEHLPSLLDYRKQSPYGARAHPSEDHIMPLFVALGAAQGQAQRIQPEITYGILAMDIYVWAGAASKTSARIQWDGHLAV